MPWLGHEKGSDLNLEQLQYNQLRYHRATFPPIQYTNIFVKPTGNVKMWFLRSFFLVVPCKLCCCRGYWIWSFASLYPQLLRCMRLWFQLQCVHFNILWSSSAKKECRLSFKTILIFFDILLKLTNKTLEVASLNYFKYIYLVLFFVNI